MCVRPRFSDHPTGHVDLARLMRTVPVVLLLPPHFLGTMHSLRLHLRLQRVHLPRPAPETTYAPADTLVPPKDALPVLRPQDLIHITAFPLDVSPVQRLHGSGGCSLEGRLFLLWAPFSALHSISTGRFSANAFDSPTTDGNCHPNGPSFPLDSTLHRSLVCTRPSTLLGLPLSATRSMYSPFSRSISISSPPSVRSLGGTLPNGPPSWHSLSWVELSGSVFGPSSVSPASPLFLHRHSFQLPCSSCHSDTSHSPPKLSSPLIALVLLQVPTVLMQHLIWPVTKNGGGTCWDLSCALFSCT